MIADFAMMQNIELLLHLFNKLVARGAEIVMLVKHSGPWLGTVRSTRTSKESTDSKTLRPSILSFS